MLQNKRLIKEGSFWAGLAVVLLAVIPFWILGGEAIFAYHDQLDGELIAYLLQARHLGQGSFLPEFLGGASKTALTPPAPAFVLLFCLFSPVHALCLMQTIGMAVGFAGMYRLVCGVTGHPVIAVLTALLYAFIPFLPVYGLSQFGLPMLLWCALLLRERELSGRALSGIFLYGVLFALTSSLVLVGFAVLGVYAVWILTDPAGERSAQKPHAGRGVFLRKIAFWCAMALCYVATNAALIAQILGLSASGGERIVSHKAEYALRAQPFWESFWSAFQSGGQHSVDAHSVFFWLIPVVFVFDLFMRKDKGIRKVTLLSFATLMLLSLTAAGWNALPVVELRKKMGALGAFQVERILWLAPCLWYLCLGCVLWTAWQDFRQSDKTFRKGISLVLCVALALGAALSGIKNLRQNDVKANLQKLRDPEYPMLGFSDYYAVGVMEQVRDFLCEETGRELSDMRVVSLGIDPAAALYHGFYCLDGYSNNYDLEYKHAFRRVIAPALAESEYLREYFDDWGNRCYLFGTESPGYYTIEKNGFYFQHLEIDTQALSELGCDYLLSAAYIADSERLNLRLMREDAFETQGSYYRIFVYEIL